MGLFITSTSQADLHGVYGIERTPPAVIQATGTATVVMVEQFPWGPEGLYACADMTDFVQKYAPYGMSRTGVGYLSIIRKKWPALKIVRVVPANAAAAGVTLSSVTPTAIVHLDLKYKGVAGNSVTAQVLAAQDGDTNHFDLVVQVTSTTGTTRDELHNLNYSGVGADSVPDFTGCKLLGAITKLAAGIPVTGTFSCTAGSDGTIAASDYVGTAGLGDHGVALCEGDPDVDFVLTADPGNSLRAAVNAGLVAHANLMGDRFAIINGNSGLAQSAVATDVGSYRDMNAVYVDVWAYITDDSTGTKRLVPPAPFFASIASQLPPSTSPAWKNPVVTTGGLGGIVDLEARRGRLAASNSKNGVVTLQKEKDGGYSFEAAVNTAAPLNPAKGTFKRSRMGHFIVRSVKDALRAYTDAPNVPEVQTDEVIAVTDFLQGLKDNAKTDAVNRTHILDFEIPSVSTFNTLVTQQAGEFTIPANVVISADQSKIFFSINYGETVTVSAKL